MVKMGSIEDALETSSPKKQKSVSQLINISKSSNNNNFDDSDKKDSRLNSESSYDSDWQDFVKYPTNDNNNTEEHVLDDKHSEKVSEKVVTFESKPLNQKAISETNISRHKTITPDKIKELISENLDDDLEDFDEEDEEKTIKMIQKLVESRRKEITLRKAKEKNSKISNKDKVHKVQQVKPNELAKSIPELINEDFANTLSRAKKESYADKRQVKPVTKDATPTNKYPTKNETNAPNYIRPVKSDCAMDRHQRVIRKLIHKIHKKPYGSDWDIEEWRLLQQFIKEWKVSKDDKMFDPIALEDLFNCDVDELNIRIDSLKYLMKIKNERS